MGRRIYVGNLPFQTSEEELRNTFAANGEVVDVKIITDRETGRPRGFAFVEMASDEEASAAISALNGTVLNGRTLTVNEAQERTGGRGGRGGGGRRW